MKTKQLFISLLSFTIILSGVSLAGAVGVWKNPTATPPGNNVDAPINVGPDAQDKSGVLRVTGFRSFFDAIFDTKVQVGTTANMPASLKLLVAGDVGAQRYCDENGQNCFNASGSGPGITNGTTCSISTAVYDSGFQPYIAGVARTWIHKLGTADTIVYLEARGGEDVGSQNNSTNPNTSVHNVFTSNYVAWFDKTSDSIKVVKHAGGNMQIRLIMWKTSVIAGC